MAVSTKGREEERSAGQGWGERAVVRPDARARACARLPACQPPSAPATLQPPLCDAVSEVRQECREVKGVPSGAVVRGGTALHRCRPALPCAQQQQVPKLALCNAEVHVEVGSCLQRDLRSKGGGSRTPSLGATATERRCTRSGAALALVVSTACPTLHPTCVESVGSTRGGQPHRHLPGGLLHQRAQDRERTWAHHQPTRSGGW